VDETGRTRDPGGTGDALTGDEADGLRYQELLDRIAEGVAGQADLEELTELEDRSTPDRLRRLEARAAERLSELRGDEDLPGGLQQRLLDRACKLNAGPNPRSRSSRITRTLTIAAAVAVIAFFASSSGLRGGYSDGLFARLPLDAARARLLTVSSDVGQWPCSGENGQPAGDVVWDNARQEGYLRLRGVNANDPARTQYQLWIYDAARDERYPVNGGVFDVAPGHAEIVVPIRSVLPIRRPSAFAVTEEPSGGVVVSSGGRLVAVAHAARQ
jgi:hypothetical protein